VAALLAAGADPSRPDAASGALPVHVAAQGGNVAVLRLLLERAPEQREAVWPLNGHTPLVEAAFNQRADAVALLLDAGADPGASSVRGRTPLSFVANETSPDGVRIRELLTGVNAPAQVDPSRLAALLSREGIRPPEPVSAQAARAIESATAVQGAITAITSATEEPQRQAAWASLRSLVDGGADLNALGGELSQPSLVFLGTTGGTEATRVEVLRYLLEHGADPFAAELHPMGVNAIFRPAVFGHAETLRVLLAAVPPERRADYVNQQGVANGMTPLHDAVLRASSGDRAVRLDVVRQLLEAGARVDVPNDAGETAADVARRLGNQEILALLG
jgi:ankyrin repeat protein